MTSSDSILDALVDPDGASRRCLLIDGHGLLYRAFFAFPVMTTGDGRHTHALFGFARMLNQLLRCWQPTHAAVAFDAGMPEHRVALLPSYKAQRPCMPDMLREQIDYVREYLDTIAIPVMTIQGEEADDIVASLVQQLLHADAIPASASASASANDEILIASSDKDLYQLVEDQVALVSPAGQTQRIGVAHVADKTGVKPECIVAWLALIGDNADNIPGVPGIGPKTAARLLNEYGNLETLWQRLSEIKSNSVRETLQANRAIVERNIALMTLHRNLPVCPSTWDGLVLPPPDAKNQAAFFQRYEIKAFAPPAPPAEQQGMLGF